MNYLNNYQPRYDIVRNPPYQINFCAKRSGKHVSVSKRWITFQFGFSSADALATGRSGVDCRGEEHEVVLKWSHITGKRQIIMDGHEIHVSKATGYLGSTRFQHSWTIPGNHVLELVVHARGSSSGGEPESWNPDPRITKNIDFDLLVDGNSFFRFMKIFELGGDECRENPFSMYDESPHYSITYNGVHYVDERDEEEEYEDEYDYPTVHSIPEENSNNDSSGNQNRLTLVMRSFSSKLEKSKSGRGLGANQDSSPMLHYGAATNEGQYSLYGNSPITVMEPPSHSNYVTPAEADLDMPVMAENSDDALYSDFVKSVNEVSNKTPQRSSKLPSLRKPSFSRSKSQGYGPKDDIYSWAVEENTPFPETNSSSTPKKGLFAMSPMKRKSYKRADSLPLPQSVNFNSSDNDYFDPGSNSCRSPSNFSFEYELMGDRKNVVDVLSNYH